MHEWALAEAVVETVSREIEKEPSRVVQSVVIGLGELQHVNHEAFTAGLDEFCQESILKPAQFTITERPARLQCRACETSWLLADSSLSEDELESIHFVPEVAHAFIACPSCGGHDFDIVEGRGVTIEVVHYADSDTPATDQGAAR